MWDLIALILILLPVDAPTPATAPQPLWDAMIRQAQRLELVSNVERWTPNFAAELGWCRLRLRELADAPPLSDADRLPDLYTIRAGLDAAEAYLQGLELRQSMDRDRWGRWEHWNALRRESASLGEIWTVALQAVSTHEWVSHRRRALAKLRDMLGGDYHDGRLPPPVALWRMQWID